MSVTLNEVALKALLETQEGPVGRYVERLAGQIVAQAQQNVRDYFHTAPSLTVDQDVGYAMDGSTATIGIDDAGEKSERLAQGQAQGVINWLSSALEAARG